jgi:hypothetical protein
MLHKVVTYFLGAAAIGLVALGLAWPSLFPPASYWSPEKALEYRDAFRAAHDAADHGSREGDSVDQQIALQRYERLQLELTDAQKAHGRAGHSLVVLGLLLLLATVLSRRFWHGPADHDS